MADIIETRSRSRSKTPGLFFSENGDSEGGKKGAKKIPTISLIEEEDNEVVGIVTQTQRPKRQRRSAKAATSDTSGDVESPKNSQKTTTEEKSQQSSQKSVTNGSEEAAPAPPAPAATNGNQEIPESQSIFNNIFNAIKTSTPILSAKKRTVIKTAEVKTSSTFTSPASVDLKAHPAYKEYKEAGEYWNKYPKTDYTYSELSPHRRQLGSGIVNMPNMSRRSLEKHQQRVENMIFENPSEESFLRRKFLTNTSFQKRSANLQYDSADEVDVSDLHHTLISRRRTQSNFFYRFYLLIVTAISSAYSRARTGVRKIFYYRPNQSVSSSRYTYTPVKNYGQSGVQRFISAIQKFVLLCASKVYLFISTILCIDTWILYTRSAYVEENKKRKRFLLGLLILLPLLLFGGTYIYLDPPKDFSFPKLTLPSLPKITLPKLSLPSLPKISLPDLSLPSLSWPIWLTLPALPAISFDWVRMPNISFDWLRLPSFSISWPEFSLPSFSFPEISLPSLSWPVWLTLPALPAISFEWLRLPSFSVNWPEFSLPSFSWPEWLALPSFSWPEFSMPSFSWPEFSLPSFSWPEWLALPSFSWPEWLALPSFSWPTVSFDFLKPITTYTAETFDSLKFSTVELFGKIRDATFGFLNEAQIVWSENFNSK